MNTTGILRLIVFHFKAGMGNIAQLKVARPIATDMVNARQTMRWNGNVYVTPDGMALGAIFT